MSCVKALGRSQQQPAVKRGKLMQTETLLCFRCVFIVSLRSLWHLSSFERKLCPLLVDDTIAQRFRLQAFANAWKELSVKSSRYRNIKISISNIVRRSTKFKAIQVLHGQMFNLRPLDFHRLCTNSCLTMPQLCSEGMSEALTQTKPLDNTSEAAGGLVLSSCPGGLKRLLSC